MTPRRWVAAAVVVLAVAGAGAALLTRDGSGDERLPPRSHREVEEVYRDELAALGLRLTRSALVDGPGAADDPALRGRHLALYVEPVASDHGPDDYLDTFVASGRVFLPDVFERWPDLASMDVCQEPPPGVDDRFAPPPYSTIEVGRAAALAFDWGTATLDDIVAASDTGTLAVFLHADLRESAGRQG